MEQNVISPKVTVLTNVGLDHTEFLGNTTEKIAREKVGIFKRGIDVVSGVTQPRIIKVVEHTAQSLSCDLDLIGRELTYDNVRQTEKGMEFDLKIKERQIKNIQLSLIGVHQVCNAALAIDAALKLNDEGFLIKEDVIRGALSKITIPCRFEMVRRRPIVILDGAHNPRKMGSLRAALDATYPGKKVTFIFAAKKDKNIKKMINKLSPIASKFYFTTFGSTTDFGRRMSYTPAELERISGVTSEKNLDSLGAYRLALTGARKEDIICITGSLYLTGELRAAILGNSKKMTVNVKTQMINII